MEASPRRLGMTATPSLPDQAARTSRCGRKRDPGDALTPLATGRRHYFCVHAIEPFRLSEFLFREGLHRRGCELGKARVVRLVRLA